MDDSRLVSQRDDALRVIALQRAARGAVDGALLLLKSMRGARPQDEPLLVVEVAIKAGFGDRTIAALQQFRTAARERADTDQMMRVASGFHRIGQMEAVKEVLAEALSARQKAKGPFRWYEAVELAFKLTGDISAARRMLGATSSEDNVQISEALAALLTRSHPGEAVAIAASIPDGPKRLYALERIAEAIAERK